MALAYYRLFQSYTTMTDENLDSPTMMPPPNLDPPTIYEFPGYDKAPYNVNVVVYHDGSVAELHTHRYVLGRSTWFEKRMRRKGLNITPPFQSGGPVWDASEEIQVISVQDQNPRLLRLFINYLYNDELHEQEVVSAVGDVPDMTAAWPAQEDQYNFRRLLGYASLARLGRFYDNICFVYLVKYRFVDAAKHMEPSDLG